MLKVLCWTWTTDDIKHKSVSKQTGHHWDPQATANWSLGRDVKDKVKSESPDHRRVSGHRFAPCPGGDAEKTDLLKNEREEWNAQSCSKRNRNCGRRVAKHMKIKPKRNQNTEKRRGQEVEETGVALLLPSSQRGPPAAAAHVQHVAPIEVLVDTSQSRGQP